MSQPGQASSKKVEVDDALTETTEGNELPASASITKKTNKSKHGSKESAKNEDSWSLMFELLVKYKKEHGDCRVPTRYPKNRRLGFWVMTQRRQYTLLHDGKSSALTTERIQALERIGFSWKVRGSRSDDWIGWSRETAQHNILQREKPDRENPLSDLSAKAGILAAHKREEANRSRLLNEQTSMAYANLTALDAQGIGRLSRYSANREPDLSFLASTSADLTNIRTREKHLLSLLLERNQQLAPTRFAPIPFELQRSPSLMLPSQFLQPQPSLVPDSGFSSAIRSYQPLVADTEQSIPHELFSHRGSTNSDGSFPPRRMDAPP